MVERRGERWRPIGGAANQLWSNQGPNCVSNQFGSQLPGNQEQSYNGEYHFHFKTPSLSANHRAAKMLLLKRFRVFETTNNKKCKPLFDRAIYDTVQRRMGTAVLWMCWVMGYVEPLLVRKSTKNPNLRNLRCAVFFHRLPCRLTGLYMI